MLAHPAHFGTDKVIATCVNSARLEGVWSLMQVLTVVAAYGWVMPRFLHRLVIDFERDMAAADAAAACQQRLATPTTGGI